MRKTALFLLAFGIAFASASLAQAQTNLQTAQPERRVLSGSPSGDIVEYSFQVPVGSGTHDVIGVHRVVRETAPWVPARSSKGILLAHGDVWNLRGRLGDRFPLDPRTGDHHRLFVHEGLGHRDRRP
jgi:hypothetical protein